MTNLITIQELAKKLDKPASTIRTWKTRGDIPQDVFFKIGGTVFVKEDKFNQWVENAS